MSDNRGSDTGQRWAEQIREASPDGGIGLSSPLGETGIEIGDFIGSEIFFMTYLDMLLTEWNVTM